MLRAEVICMSSNRQRIAGSIVFAGSGHHLGLGPGGIERLIVYPLIIWSMRLGGALMGLTLKSEIDEN